jgi:Ca-activated chloride channel family protein
VALFVFPCVFFASNPSDAPISYRTGASEVRITFFATDDHNQPVPNIGRDDFAIVDNEVVLRDFRSLNPSNETPLDIVLLVDASGSVAPQFHAVITDILDLASMTAAVPGDQMSLITFAGSQPALLCHGDCSVAVLEEKFAEVKPSGLTPLFDALDYSARYLSSRHAPGTQQVLILLSDGNDTASRSTSRDALNSVLASGAILYAIDITPRPHVSEGSASLQSTAQATGGRSLSLQNGAADALQSVLADLRASYVVTYSLPNRSAGFHSLRILPKHDSKLHFHCRRGYFYEESR